MLCCPWGTVPMPIAKSEIFPQGANLFESYSRFVCLVHYFNCSLMGRGGHVPFLSKLYTFYIFALTVSL